MPVNPAGLFVIISSDTVEGGSDDMLQTFFI